MTFAGYYKMPAPQTETENCVAHNGSLIPVPGRDIMVQGWYQGGVSVFDFTDSKNPVEIAYFDRGPLDPKNLIIGGYWSAYWYNGNIYGAEISRGMDIFRLVPTQYLSQNEIDAAIQVRATEFNAQNQPLISWPATSIVAKAYLDQLGRNNAISAERAKAVRDGLAKVDELRTGKERDAAARLDALTARRRAGGSGCEDQERPRRDAADGAGRHVEGPQRQALRLIRDVLLMKRVRNVMRLARLAAGIAVRPCRSTIVSAQQPAAPARTRHLQAARRQQRPDPVPPDNLPRPSTTDPRANLKPGAVGQKAAEAAWNMELVSNLPKPEGFSDPANAARHAAAARRCPKARRVRRRIPISSASRTRTSRSAAATSWSATITGSTPTTSSAPTSRS